jgi:hypothetical protein
MKEAKFGDKSPEYLSALQERWSTLYFMGRFEEAYALNQKWEIHIKNTPKRFGDSSSSAFNSLNPAINLYSH